MIVPFLLSQETPGYLKVLLSAGGSGAVLGLAAGVIALAIRNRNVPEYERGLLGWVLCVLGLLVGAVLQFGMLAGAVFIILHELSGVRSSVSRWLRAPVAALGCVAGAILCGLLGFHWFETTGFLIGASFGAILGDLLALVIIGIIVGLTRSEGYLVALTVPCVLAYLLGWLIAGLAAPSIFAPILVVLLMVGPVIAIVAVRLLHDFSDAAIALVLERRFPKKLGDRLITAVELANPKRSARYGYSQVMIEQTIHDAAERVASVPVSKVFHWKRLGRYWMARPPRPSVCICWRASSFSSPSWDMPRSSAAAASAPSIRRRVWCWNATCCCAASPGRGELTSKSSIGPRTSGARSTSAAMKPPLPSRSALTSGWWPTRAAPKVGGR